MSYGDNQMSSDGKVFVTCFCVFIFALISFVTGIIVNSQMHAERHADEFRVCVRQNHPVLECRTAVWGPDQPVTTSK